MCEYLCKTLLANESCLGAMTGAVVFGPFFITTLCAGFGVLRWG